MSQVKTRDLLGKIRDLTSDSKRFPIAVCEKHDFLNPRVDADYVAVTKAGQIYEYEAKISRADFIRDFRKKRHKIYSGELTRQGRRELVKPNRFYYVTAPEIITEDDLPEYAGWYEFDPVPGRPLILRREAPRIRKEKHELKVFLQLAGSMRWRGT